MWFLNLFTGIYNGIKSAAEYIVDKVSTGLRYVFGSSYFHLILGPPLGIASAIFGNFSLAAAGALQTLLGWSYHNQDSHHDTIRNLTGDVNCLRQHQAELTQRNHQLQGNLTLAAVTQNTIGQQQRQVEELNRQLDALHLDKSNLINDRDVRDRRIQDLTLENEELRVPNASNPIPQNVNVIPPWRQSTPNRYSFLSTPIPPLKPIPGANPASSSHVNSRRGA